MNFVGGLSIAREGIETSGYPGIVLQENTLGDQFEARTNDRCVRGIDSFGEIAQPDGVQTIMIEKMRRCPVPEPNPVARRQQS